MRFANAILFAVDNARSAGVWILHNIVHVFCFVFLTVCVSSLGASLCTLDDTDCIVRIGLVLLKLVCAVRCTKWRA